MSGIKFASEGENLSSGSRPRPKKRLSSILKSPSRNALHDLDPNADERDTCTTSHAIKKRCTSRRVSFANTHQVQEFLTTNQLKILEDTNTEKEITQPTSTEKDVQPSAYSTPSSVSAMSVSSVQDARSTQAHLSDISVGPGHCVSGLETLLSGPIKNQSHPQPEAITSNPVIPHVILKPREGAVQLPMIDETCEIPVKSKVGSSTAESSDLYHHETDGTQNWPGLADNCDNLTVGLLGPSYHCTLPVAESFSSSCHASFSSSFAFSANHTEICDSNVNLDDTANFELTLCREQYLAAGTVYEQPRDPIIKKQDASSFLKSFMETDQADDSFRQPAHSTFQTYADENYFENQPPKLDSKDFLKSFMASNSPQPTFPGPGNCACDNLDSSPKKRDAKRFLQSLFGNESWQPPVTATAEETCIFSQNETAAEMDLTACVNVGETRGCKKKDASAFLKSLAEKDTSDGFGHPGHSTFLSKVNEHHDGNQTTRDLGQDDDVTSGMDFTTCVGGMLQAKDASAIPTNYPDMTVRFGDGNTGNMEFTQCIGGVQEQLEREKPSSQMHGRGSRPLEDITRIFNGAEMDLTICRNPLRANSLNHSQLDNRDGQTRIFRHDDTTAAMEMTTCLDNQSSLVKSGKKAPCYDSSKNAQPDGGLEKTRIFRHDDTTAAMEMTTCLDNQASLVKSGKKDPCKDSLKNTQPDGGLKKTKIFCHDDTTATMEMATCLDNQASLIKSGKKDPHKDFSKNAQPDGELKQTRIFHHDDTTAAIEMTTCLDNQSSLMNSGKTDPCKDSLKNTQPDGGLEKTRIFRHDDTTAAMEMTTCLDNQAIFLNSGKKDPCKDSLKNTQLDGGLEKTRIFRHDDTTAAMEMTTCLVDQGKNVRSSKSCSGRGFSDTLQLNAAEEKTNIFLYDETTAAMEMTTCLNGNTSLKSSKNSSDPDSSNNFKPNEALEKTRMFHHDGNTAAMELTTCLGNSSSNKLSSNLDSGNNNEPHPMLEETRIFFHDDTTAAMEMTECLDEKASFTKQGTSFSQSDTAQQGSTKAYIAGHTGKNEISTCIEGTFHKAQMMQENRRWTLDTDPIKEPVVGDVSCDKTQVFMVDDTAGMDFTTCIGGVLLEQSSLQENQTRKSSTTVAKQINTLHKLYERGGLSKSVPEFDRQLSRALPTFQQEDSTRNFTSDDTARMEMTTCIGGVLQNADAYQLSFKQVDNTQIFTPDDMAQMDQTACVGSLQSLPSMVSPSGKKAQSTTCQDETSKMEMTACVGGIFPKMSVDSSQNEPSKRLGDHAKISSAGDASSIDITKCIGGRCLQSLIARTQPDNNYDSTKVFTSDDTARMEMTTCIGGIFSKTSEKTTAVPDSTETVSLDCLLGMKMKSAPRETDSVTSSTSQQHYLPDQTRIFTSDSTASMEITMCIGGINKNTQSSDDHSLGAFTDKVDLSQTSGSGRFPSEQTCLFTHDNTGKMELTTCIGGISARDLAQPYHDKSASPPSDSTRLFNHEETSKMELTKCIGVIELKTMDLLSTQSTQSTVPSQAFGNLPSKLTNLFSHDEAGQMESASCDVGLMDVQLEQTREMVDNSVQGGEQSGDKNILIASEKKLSQESTDCRGTQIAPLSEQSQGVHPGLISAYPAEAMEVNRCDTNRHESPDLVQLADSNKTTTKEAYSPKRHSDTFTLEPSSISMATEPTTRRSDTYTLDKPPAASTMIENPNAATDNPKHDSDCLTDFTSNQDSPGEDGAGVIGDLNRWGSLDSDDGIDNEQPVWVENTEDFAQLSAEAGVARVMMMEAIKDESDSKHVYELPTFARDAAQDMTAASQMQDVDEKMKPPSGPVSMQDFLECVTINMSKGRRSVLPCMPQVASPKTLSDFMEDHYILKPKKELYEWAVSHLSSSIEKMQEAVNEQEQRMSEDNPEIVTEVQCASPEKAAKLHECIESLHKACTKMSRGSFQEWRLKMVSKTHQSFKQTEEEMDIILASLSSSLDTLNKNLEELRKFKEGLDETLTRLQSVEPPRDEQIKEFIDLRNQLAKRQVEIEQMKNDKAALESESLNLKSDIKQFEKELADIREKDMLLSSQTTSEDGLEEAMIKLEDLHCLQEWRLRKYSEEEFVFTFLEDSLVFTVKLGKQIDSGDGDCVKQKEIVGIHTESLLADDANVCAQLAHNLIQASVDADVLRSLHPTTITLKALLQEVSILVSQADGIADETDKIRYRHVVTLDGTNPIVEFSNLDVMVKFWVTFNLLPGSYPFSAISADFKHKIGKLGDQDVQSALSQVKPGWMYFSRLVHSVDALIQQYIPSDPIL